MNTLEQKKIIFIIRIQLERTIQMKGNPYKYFIDNTKAVFQLRNNELVKIKEVVIYMEKII